jgi:hypothetical protein
MNGIQGGRVTSYMIDIRYSAAAELRGGQVPGSSKLGQRAKGASWEIITPAIVLHSNGESTTLLPQSFQSIFGPTQERDKWRVPL